MRKKFLVFIFITLIVFQINACNNGDSFESVVSGDFIYSKWSMAEEEVSIIGLSDEGLEKETLVFPATIDGYKVTQIGNMAGLKDSGPLYIKNAINIYFGSNITQVVTSIEYIDIDSNSIINVYVGGQAVASELYAWTYQYSNIHVYLSEYEFSKLMDDEIIYGKFISSNVEYYVDDQIYFIDNVEGETINIIPPIPHKNGYEFVGWFKDELLSQSWNFAEDVVANKIYDENNYIKNITKIYAKWEIK